MHMKILIEINVKQKKLLLFFNMIEIIVKKIYYTIQYFSNDTSSFLIDLYN